MKWGSLHNLFLFNTKNNECGIINIGGYIYEKY